MNRVIRFLPYVIVSLIAILLFNRFTTGSWAVSWDRGPAATGPEAVTLSPASITPPVRTGLPVTASPMNAGSSALSRNSVGPSGLATAAPPSPLAGWLDRLNRNTDPSAVRPDEAVVMFTTDAAFLRFLRDTPSLSLTIPGHIPELRAVRVQMDSVAVLGKALEPVQDEILDLSPNLKMFLTLQRPDDEPTWGITTQLANLLSIPTAPSPVGSRGGVQRWGRGLVVALLDTGVSPDGFRDPSLLGTYDVGWGVNPVGIHGTMLAHLLAGAGGVAPGAGLMAVRVTDSEQVSDVFSVAMGIVGATTGGASIIEVSPASPVASALLAGAVELADANGVAVVAANGGVARSWPAANRRVLGINSVIAPRLPVAFDGSSVPQLSQGIPAVTLGINVPGDGPQQIIVDAPASATLVAGSLAAVFSAYPRISAAQAWTSLQQNETSQTAVAANVEGLYAAGYQVLNLGWIATPFDFGPAGSVAATGDRSAENPPARIPVAPSAGGNNRSGGGASVANPNRGRTGPPTGQGTVTPRGVTPTRGTAANTGLVKTAN